MRLPSDPDNITPNHIDRLIEMALREYAKYERNVDFTWPQERIDDLYRPYAALVMTLNELKGSHATREQRKLIEHLP